MKRLFAIGLSLDVSASGASGKWVVRIR